MSSRVYAGTRAFALKGTLLDRATLESLVSSATLDELVNRLRGTSYSGAVSKLQPAYSARRIELALRERFDDAHFLLMRGASGYNLLSLYYLKNIAWDLKSVLKSKALGKSYDESVEYMDLHSEELVGRRDLIAKILSSKDIQEAGTLLSGTEFGEDVKLAINAFSTTNEVRFFDLYIDHAILSRIAKSYLQNSRIYSSSRGASRAGVRDLVAVDIDTYNALSVLRAKLWGLPPSEIEALIVRPTFRIPANALQAMINAGSTVEAAKLIQAYSVPEQLTGDDDSIISAVEDAFADEARRTALGSFVWQVLGPANAIAIVKLLESEVRNLSAIAIGVEAHLPAKDVLAKLKL